MLRKPNTINEMKYFNFSFEPGKEISKRISINSNEPLVSIISIYNCNSDNLYIDQVFRTLKNQTFPYFEWIIITNSDVSENDNLFKSKDLLKDKRVKIIKQDFTTVSEAKMIAANLAKTDLLFILDFKNLIDKTLLECGYFAMKFNPDAAFSFSRVVEFGDNEQLHNTKFSISEEKRKNIIPSSVFIRKDIFLKEYATLGNDNYEDWYLWLKLLSKKFVPLKMGYYGCWHRNLKKTPRKPKLISDEEASEKILKISKEIDSKLEIIQFDDSYEVDYKNVPEKIDLKRKSIVPDDKTKRILFILPWSVVGGADIFNLNLIKGLRQKGYEISVVTTQKCDYALRQGVEQYVDEYFDLTSFLKRKDWASFIAYIIKSRRINVVFLSNSYYGYYAVPWLKCQFKEIPFVDYIHAENWTLRNGGFPKDSNAIADYLDATYTCTSHLRDIMYKTMKRDVKNVKPIYIGTDSDYYNPEISLEMDDELEKKFKNKKVILFPSRIVHYKRPLFAVKVMEGISKIRDDVCLVIVGDGDALEDVKKYVIDNNLEEYVYCYGIQQDVRPFYKIAALTLICSLREGLTLTTYESLAMGVPIVSSDVGGQSELIESDCGILIRPFQTPDEQFDFNYSEEELGEYIMAVLCILDEYKKDDVRQICRNKILKKFTIGKMVSNLDKEFTKLIDNGSKINRDLCKKIGLAERYLLVHSVLESKDERKKY